jgi:hypothetical protein
MYNWVGADQGEDDSDGEDVGGKSSCGQLIVKRTMMA